MIDNNRLMIKIPLSLFSAFCILKAYNIKTFTPVFLLIAVTAFFLISLALKVTDRRTIVISAVFSGLYSVCAVVGYDIFRNVSLVNNFLTVFALKYVIYISGYGILIYSVTASVLDYFNRRPMEITANESNKKLFLLCWALIVISRIPYILAFYPALLSVDSLVQLEQAAGESPLQNYHPVLHTLIIKLFYSIGSLLGGRTNGIGFYTIFQVVFTSLCYAYTIYWMYLRGVKKWLLWVTFIYFTFIPLHAFYSVIIWKDILFSCVCLILILKSIDIIESGGACLADIKSLILFIALLITVPLIRNNGIFVLCIFAPVLIFTLRASWKRLTLIFASVLLFVVIIKGPVFSYFNIPDGHIIESLGVPLTQIGRTVYFNDDTLDDDIKRKIERLMPIQDMKDTYSPFSIDDMKYSPQFKGHYNGGYFPESFSEFLGVWRTLLFKYPQTFVEAYLTHTLGYWNPDTYTWSVSFEYREAQTPASETLYELLKALNPVNANDYNIPIMSYLYSIGFMVWACFFAVAALIVKKDKKYTAALIIPISIWITLMIGSPTYCELRYAYVFFLALPISVMLVVSRKTNPPGVVAPAESN